MYLQICRNAYDYVTNYLENKTQFFLQVSFINCTFMAVLQQKNPGFPVEVTFKYIHKNKYLQHLVIPNILAKHLSF